MGSGLSRCRVAAAGLFAALCLAPEERQQNDDGERYPKQPKQCASSERHGRSPLVDHAREEVEPASEKNDAPSDP